MGNSRGRPPDDRLGPAALPGPDAREQGDRGRLALREPGAARRRSSAAGACTCSASSRTAASTRTSTTCRRCSRFAPEKTWIHAFTDGRDVSPHAALDDLADAAAGPDRDRRRPLLRDGPRQALGAHAARLRRDHRAARARTPATCSTAVQASYDAGVTDEFIEPIVRRRARRGSSPATPRSSSTSAPTAAASSRALLLDAGFDLTTMTRYATTSTARSPSTSRTSRTRSPRCSSRHGLAAAARRRDREVRPRDVLLQRRARGGVAGRDARSSSRARATCRATTTSRRCRPTRSPTAFCAEVGDGYAFCRRQLREPGHGRPHRRRSRRSSRRSRRPTAASAGSSTA